MLSSVTVERLSKQFKVPVRERSGLRASISSLFKRQHRTVEAVDEVSFTIAPGEVVGFLGPNGAGKTTTLKMLSGLLSPTGGSARVLGFEPFRRENEFLRRITLVMGNRNQLQWDLPAIDSFELHRAIYRIPRPEFLSVRDELIDLLDLGALVDKPVRTLSLGERMKAEIADALLHQPEVMFLDEPTLGLDVTMQRRIRSFLADYNSRTGASILLTSHYMADVEALCKRVLVIHHGHLLFDGDLTALAARFGTHKTIRVQLDEAGSAGAGATAVSAALAEARTCGIAIEDATPGADGFVTLQVDRAHAPRAAALLLERLDIVDVSIEDPPIERIIDEVFTGELISPCRRPLERPLRSLAAVYHAVIRTSMVDTLQYRVNTFVELVLMLAEPLVYLDGLADRRRGAGRRGRRVHTGALRRLLHHVDTRADDDPERLAGQLGVVDQERDDERVAHPPDPSGAPEHRPLARLRCRAGDVVGPRCGGALDRLQPRAGDQRTPGGGVRRHPVCGLRVAHADPRRRGLRRRSGSPASAQSSACSRSSSCSCPDGWYPRS